MNLSDFVSLSLFLLVVINPVSKATLVTSLSSSHTTSELKALARAASLVGLALLVAFAFAGKFILRDVFHINLYSVELAGGVAIFLTGLEALREGRFFRLSGGGAIAEISAAPIAMPMIAGPATIAAVISAAVSQPPWFVSLAVVPGMAVNFGTMMLAAVFARRFARSRVLGPLVRITGLFMAAIGAEMILSGLGEWLIGAGITR